MQPETQIKPRRARNAFSALANTAASAEQTGVFHRLQPSKVNAFDRSQGAAVNVDSVHREPIV